MTVLYILLAFMFGTCFGFGVYAFCNISHDADVEQGEEE